MSGQVVVASYERVSTFVQAQRGYSLGAQTQDIDAFVAKNGWVLPDHLRFRDGDTQNASGASWDLPGLNAMLAAAKRGEFQIVVTPDFDRFARNMVKALILEAELKRDGVKVIFLRVPLEDTAEGRLLKNQLLSFAEYEREKIALRTNRGRRAKAEKGLVVGVGKAPYGYQYVVHSERGQRVGLEPDPDTAPTAVWILTELFKRSTHDIAAQLRADAVPPPVEKNGRWAAGTVLRIARNSVYKGSLRYSKVNPIYIDVPPLIDPGTWADLQKALDNRRINKTRRGRKPVHEDPFMLRSRLTCGHCGGAISTWANGPYRYYRCLRSFRPSDDARCVMPSVQAAAIEDHLWDIIRETLLNTDALETGIAAMEERQYDGVRITRERMAALEQAIVGESVQLDRQAARLGVFEPGSESKASILKAMHNHEKKIARLREEQVQLANVTPVGISPESVATVRAFANQVAAGLKSATAADRREIAEILGIVGILRVGDEDAVQLGLHRVQIEWNGAITLFNSGSQSR